MWVRNDARRRAGALIGLAVLIMLTGGAALAATAGARRSATAFERLRVRTLAMDAAVFGTAAETKAAVSDSLVAAAAPFSIAAVASLDDPDVFPFIVPGNDAIGRTIERPLILHGRRADPTRADEIVLPEGVARRLHKDVGDEMRFRSIKIGDDTDIESENAKTDGPRFSLRVVGVSRATAGLVVRDSDIQFVYLTPGWRDRYAAKIAQLGDGMIVRLRHGFADFGAWSRNVNPNADPTASPTPLFSPAPVEDSVSVIVDGLRLFALIAVIAGILAVAQAIVRHVAGSAPDIEILQALGASRRTSARASAGAVLPALVGGAIGAFVLAYAWSPFMPIGLARRAEPDRGWSFDGRVLIGGTLALLVVVLAITAGVAWRVSVRRSPAGARRSPQRGAMSLTALPPVMAAGLHLATGKGQGRDLVPTRSAMSGVAVAVAGVVAVSMFASGLHRLVGTPERYGVPWDATVYHGNNEPPIARDRAALERLPEVHGVALVHVQLGGLLDGRDDGAGFALDSPDSTIAPIARAGRAPVADGEIALGADTLHRLHLRLGDRVRLTGTGGSRRMRIVGETLMPTVDDPATLASGFLVTGRTAKALQLEQDDAFSRLVVTFRPDVSRAKGARALTLAGFHVSTPTPPPEVARLRDVESLPLALAIILALIGSIVVALALVVTVRSRRRDLAMLHAFGFTRRQVTGAVMYQAGAFAVVGIVVGAPLGLLVGRFTWHKIAGALGTATDTPIPGVAIALTMVGVVVVAVVASLIPARRAARLRPAEVLHQE